MELVTEGRGKNQKGKKMTLDSYFTRIEEETPVQRNWRNFQQCKELDVNIDNVIYSTDARIEVGGLRVAKDTLDADTIQAQRWTCANYKLVYAIEDGNLIKHRFEKKEHSRTVMNDDPSIQDRKEVNFLLGIGTIALAGPVVFSILSIIEGYYEASIALGVAFGSAAMYANLAGTRMREEEQGDRIAWKLYQNHIKK